MNLNGLCDMGEASAGRLNFRKIEREVEERLRDILSKADLENGNTYF